MLRAMWDKLRRFSAQRKLHRAIPMPPAGMDDELVRARKWVEERTRILEALETEARIGVHHHSRKGDV